MEFSHYIEEQILTIVPHGDSLDAKEAPSFKEKVLNLIIHQNNLKVILDLHNLTFIDSSGLGCFLSLLRALNTHGGDLKLACMTKPIRMMFEIVCMHKVFEIFNSIEEAKRSFK